MELLWWGMGESKLTIVDLTPPVRLPKSNFNDIYYLRFLVRVEDRVCCWPNTQF